MTRRFIPKRENTSNKTKIIINIFFVLNVLSIDCPTLGIDDEIMGFGEDIAEP
jgi:hypothetical protein